MLTTTAQHALRALVELARLEQGHSLGGKELARRAKIPANYLSKILWTLGSTGMIDATRGTRGGYRLGRAPGSVRLIEVVELFDRARTGDGCLLDTAHPCGEATACAAHAAWSQVKAAYRTFLEQTTLAMLAERAAAQEAARS